MVSKHLVEVSKVIERNEMAGLVKRGKIYYCRLQHGGRETWVSTHQTAERPARKAADRIESLFLREKATKQLTGQLLEVVKQLASGQLSVAECAGPLAAIEAVARQEALKIVDDLIPAPPLSASELWERYLSSNHELKASSFTTKRQRFNKFAEWAADYDMRMVSDRQCKKFLDSLGVAAQTRNGYISDLSSVWKASPGLTNPWTENLRQKARNVHKKPFSRDQVRQLLTHCEKNGLKFWHTAIMLSYYTGLRLKDVVFFRRDQITPDGYIELVPEKTARTQKRVRVPINAQLRRELDTVISIGPEFFPEEARTYERCRNLISRQFRELLEDVRLYAPGYGFHSLRHTFVTEALNAGVDIKQVQAAVGHDAVEITEGIYYHGKQNADLSAYPEL